MKLRILLIENDWRVARALRKKLEAAGYAVVLTRRGDDGLALAKTERFDLLLTAFKLPGLSGLELLSQLHPLQPALPIILITRFGTTDTAIEATKLGAFDYFIKPCKMDELLDCISKALAANQPAPSVQMEFGDASAESRTIVGNSRPMQNLCKQIGLAAATSVTTLIRGQTGTGKELVAHAIHDHSDRAPGPFVALNCTALPETLLESELFGHERGSFTGALARRVGRFEEANRGTLFLDEIGDLAPGMQVKLLRVLEEKRIHRLGGNESIPVDVRVLAATHRDLETAIAQDRFRADLFYRLNALTITLPALHERPEDIPGLVAFFLRRLGRDAGVATPSIQKDALDFLQQQPWPGNVRELENAVRRARLLAHGHPITLADVQQAYAAIHPATPATDNFQDAYFDELLAQAGQGRVRRLRIRVLDDAERGLFAHAIRAARGNQARAARLIGVTRTTMREKLRHFSLGAPASPPAFSPA